MTERRTAVITGAASGIGLETARRFFNDLKYNPIFVVDKSSEIHTVFLETSRTVPLQMDLRDKDQIQEMLKIAADSGRIDLIVNAAGVIYAGKPSTCFDKDGKPKPELKDMEAINVDAPIIILVDGARLMGVNGGGTIVNITSSKHFFPDVYRWQYMDGKRTVSKVTRGVAKKWKTDYNVRLVDLQPGNTKTNIDRGVWTDGNGKAEMEAVQGFNDWWRKTFGNDPKNVAEVIYKIAEREVNGNTVYVGWDAKLGRVLSFIPFSGDIFLAGSYSLYKAVEAVRKIRKKK